MIVELGTVISLNTRTECGKIDWLLVGVPESLQYLYANFVPNQRKGLSWLETVR
jgi:hypothetical protein